MQALRGSAAPHLAMTITGVRLVAAEEAALRPAGPNPGGRAPGGANARSASVVSTPRQPPEG